MNSARRLQDDYRRILGITEDTRGLDDSLPRMRIEGQRGIFQIGSGETKSGSAGGEDEDGNPVSPITPDENQDNQNSDGSGQGGSGTDSGATDGSDFEINPDDAPAGVDINDSTFGDGWATGGATRLQDCETEQCIELVEVGGYVPPQGWDGWNNPPLMPDWEMGFYYISNVNSVDLWGYTVSDVFNKAPQGFTLANGYSYEKDRIVVLSNGQIVIRYIRTESGPQQILTYTVFKVDCLNLTSTERCPTENPVLEHTWPADNCIQLAPNAQGNWQASPRENPADMTAKYSEAKSVLNLCNSAGESIEVYPRRGGGYVYFNADQGIWAGSDASGRKRSFGSSSTLNQEIARG